MDAKFDIRWAQSDDVEGLAKLAVENDMGGFEWSDPGLTWLIALDATGEVRGALQVMAGYPLGRMEMLMLPASLHGASRRWPIIRELTDRASAILRAAGCQAVVSSIPSDDPHYLEVAIDCGWKRCHEAVFIMLEF